MILLHILLFLLIVFLIARTSISALVWTVSIIIILVLHLFWAAGWISNLILLLIAAAMSFMVLMPDLRKSLISARVFDLLKNHLPAMSDTEREAIESGTVTWEAEIFRGNPNWEVLTSYPDPSLSKSEKNFLENETGELCSKIDDWQVNQHDKDLTQEAWSYIKQHKFFGLIIPEKYGGLGFSEQAHAAVVTKLSTRSVTAAVTVMVPNSLGPGKLINHYGSDEQKDYYLPRLARGDEIPCFALTAPTAGSDAAAIPDTGIISKGEYDGREVIGLKLNWDKRYITLAPVATILGLAFHALDPDGLLGGEEYLGLTCALVPTDTPGVIIGRRHNPVATPFHNGPTRGKDVFIPLDFVIGGKEQIGKGWKMLMELLAVGRGISLPALGNATGQFGVVSASAYATVRKQFNLSIGKFEGVAEKIAIIGGHSYAMDACSKLITSTVLDGEKPAVLSAMIKYFNTESARLVSDANMDIHAGKGIIRGPNNYLAESHKSMPISITVEGANILTRTLMIFGQGAIRCHPYLQKVMQSMADDDLAAFDQAFSEHLGYYIKNKSRAFLYSFSAGWLSDFKTDFSYGKKYVRKINALSASLAMISDGAFGLLGGKLKRMEMLTGQFADAWIGLCVCSAVLKKHYSEGSPVDEQPLVDWICQSFLHQSYQALNNVVTNLPFGILSNLLGFFYLPKVGIPKPPCHSLSLTVSKLLLEDTDVKRRLTSWCYIPTAKNDALRQLLDAYELMPFMDEIDARVKKASVTKSLLETETMWLEKLHDFGVVNKREMDKYAAGRELIAKVIAVDDFAPENF